mmetsp:Transcript_13428/g.26559  ORF Transcript_13428/g.26559 Transcript_13428/m.26559 type:complete len:201 (+) Transcript_13428:2753-3355(+)
METDHQRRKPALLNHAVKGEEPLGTESCRGSFFSLHFPGPSCQIWLEGTSVPGIRLVPGQRVEFSPTVHPLATNESAPNSAPLPIFTFLSFTYPFSTSMHLTYADGCNTASSPISIKSKFPNPRVLEAMCTFFPILDPNSRSTGAMRGVPKRNVLSMEEVHLLTVHQRTNFQDQTGNSPSLTFPRRVHFRATAMRMFRRW